MRKVINNLSKNKTRSSEFLVFIVVTIPVLKVESTLEETHRLILIF